MFDSPATVPDADNATAGSCDCIRIRGAREHNLQNIDVDIPRGKLVVVTGVSGSGKSTLAFDILFAEGQRRFLDSMNAYARQFVEQMSRPDVDLVDGIPPTVSIEQRTSRGGGKSTIATVTEVYHFIRLLFARLGVQYCPDCQQAVEPQTRDQVAQRVRETSRECGALSLLAPVVRNRKGFHTDLASWAARNGYQKVRADGKMHDADSPLRLDRFREHDVEIVTGEVAPKMPAEALRLLVERTLELGQGTLFTLDRIGDVGVHSTERACGRCGRSFPPLDPKFFSYNSSQGWCAKCRGFGELFYLPEVERGARADAIEESWFGWMEGKRELCPDCGGMRLNPVARAVRVELGGGGSGGGAGAKAARGTGLAAKQRHTIDDFNRATVQEAFEFFKQLRLDGVQSEVARDILPEIRERLRFLQEVGLGYLDLGRAVTTLSGGEGQRIRLAAQLGSNLTGVLYVLDEPTIGLHARDNERLLETLERLRERGNSLVVVEHDEETMRRADYIIDLGPGAGRFGGKVVAAGSLEELASHEDSVTGRALRQKRTYPSRGERRPVSAFRAGAGVVDAAKREKDKESGRVDWLVLEGAAVHNLKRVKLRLPLNRLVVVTGVSGSGKSTLVRECLLPALAVAFAEKENEKAGKGKGKRGAVPAPQHGEFAGRITQGAEVLDEWFEVDQSPIGRTPRSTPATYVGFFDDIRAIFAQIPESRLRGYGPGRFSFNSAAGRCPGCEGAGVVKLEMNFLPPAYVTCETCAGLRFNPETLDVRFQGRNIAEVLELSVAEAATFFSSFNRIRRPLEALIDTGLDYLKLGQTSPTLSGGEAQRVKLVTHLLSGLKPSPTSRATGKPRLFVLEEPTIGLHMADVDRLLGVLHRLVDAGHSVVVIEHHLDLIAEADWVVDLGPEAGAGGGRIVAEGTPEKLASIPESHTGRYLSPLLARR